MPLTGDYHVDLHVSGGGHALGRNAENKFMPGLVVFLILIAATLGFGAFGWNWYHRDSSLEVSRWRRSLGFLGLLAVSVQVFLFFAFEDYGFVIGNFDYRTKYFFSWARVNSGLCAFVLLAALFGKGRFRLPMALSTLAIAAIWFILGLGS